MADASASLQGELNKILKATLVGGKKMIEVMKNVNELAQKKTAAITKKEEIEGLISQLVSMSSQETEMDRTFHADLMSVLGADDSLDNLRKEFEDLEKTLETLNNEIETLVEDSVKLTAKMDALNKESAVITERINNLNR
jgi:chromosome segregation ATPase